MQAKHNGCPRPAMRNILIIPLVFGLGAAQAVDTTLTLAC
jgi:hypothetical protein